MTDQSATPALKRSIGTRTATALVIGNMVGSGVFLLPAALASEAGPISILAWVFTGLGALLLGLVFARLGRAIPRSGGPYAYAQRAFGDFVGFQTAWGYWIAVWAGNAAIAVAFAGYLSVYWSKAATSWVTALIAIGLVWIATAVNIAGVREGGARPGRDDHPQVRAAARDRGRRPLLHQDRQLPPLHDQAQRRPRNQRRGGAHALGVHRPRVGDGRRRRGPRPRAHAPPRDDLRDARGDAPLPDRDGRDLRDDPNPRAGGLEQPVRRRRQRHLRRHLGRQGDRCRRDDLDLRRAQRLDAAPGARAARGGRGRALPEPLRTRPRPQRHARVRPRRLVAARDRAAAALPALEPRRHLLQRHPAGDADDPRPLCLLGGGRALPPLQGAIAVLGEQAGTRRDHLRPRVRLLRLGDLGRRREDDRLGLHAPARRHPRLRLAEVAAVARRNGLELPPRVESSPDSRELVGAVD